MESTDLPESVLVSKKVGRGRDEDRSCAEFWRWILSLVPCTSGDEENQILVENEEHRTLPRRGTPSVKEPQKGSSVNPPLSEEQFKKTIRPKGEHSRHSDPDRRGNRKYHATHRSDRGKENPQTSPPNTSPDRSQTNTRLVPVWKVPERSASPQEDTQRAKRARWRHTKSKNEDIIRFTSERRSSRSEDRNENFSTPICGAHRAGDRRSDCDPEGLDEDEEDDPLLDRLREIHEGVKRANEQRQRNMLDFERSINARMQQAYEEGGVRMAEYILRELIVNNGLCIIWTKEVAPARVDELTEAYSRFCFEVEKEIFGSKGMDDLAEKDVGAIDFMTWHFAFQVSDREITEFCQWLIDCNSEMISIPKIVFVQTEGAFLEDTLDFGLPNTMTLRSNSTSYDSTYARLLQLHGESLDIQTILTIAEGEETKNGYIITRSGGISAKIFFKAQ